MDRPLWDLSAMTSPFSGLTRSALAVGFGLVGLPALAADVLDCAAALKAADPNRVGRAGTTTGNGWSLSREEPAIISAKGNRRAIGHNASVESEMDDGDSLQATIIIFDTRSDNTRSKPVVDYRSRWISPVERKMPDGRLSRCLDEAPARVEAGKSMIHALKFDDAELTKDQRKWQFLTYDLTGNPLFVQTFVIQRTKSRQQVDEDELSKIFQDYLELGKCFELAMTPLSRETYRQAIAQIDKSYQAKGLDTSSVWNSAAESFKTQLDSWDRRIAGSTSLNWEQRSILKDFCAIASRRLMQAFNDARGGSAPPKKDF